VVVGNRSHKYFVAARRSSTESLELLGDIVRARDSQAGQQAKKSMLEKSSQNGLMQRPKQHTPAPGCPEKLGF
jgi:hypothetical protein